MVGFVLCAILIFLCAIKIALWASQVRKCLSEKQLGNIIDFEKWKELLCTLLVPCINKPGFLYHDLEAHIDCLEALNITPCRPLSNLADLYLQINRWKVGLGINRKWVAINTWFWVRFSFGGINVVDLYHICKYRQKIPSWIQDWNKCKQFRSFDLQVFWLGRLLIRLTIFLVDILWPTLLLLSLSLFMKSSISTMQSFQVDNMGLSLVSNYNRRKILVSIMMRCFKWPSIMKFDASSYEAFIVTGAMGMDLYKVSYHSFVNNAERSSAWLLEIILTIATSRNMWLALPWQHLLTSTYALPCIITLNIVHFLFCEFIYILDPIKNRLTNSWL